MTYPDLNDNQPALEERLLELWREEDLFSRTLQATADGEEFVFFEGPPTANGRPGLHHVISRAIKDLVCRFRTMQGRHVTRIAGWDTHGLPVEIEAEKKLGISGKRQIEETGVARFNNVCRDSVFTYKEEWERLSERIGYWLDYSRPYVTYHPEYIETVWWILKCLHERDLLYRGHRSVPYCPRCGTALSSHEVALGYEEILDHSLFFLCPWLDESGRSDPDGRAFLVWTTTPWTVPSNVALAVHPAMTYVEVEFEGRRLVLAEARLEVLAGEADISVLRRYQGSELVDQRYERPLDLVPCPDDAGNAWRVVAEDFVSGEEGTGLVHMAPAFGADDYLAGQRHGLPMLRPVDDAGRFNEGIPLVGGKFVKDADQLLLEELKRRGFLFRSTMEEHTYPHCWRCSSPLIYMARDSWYIRTTAVKDQMLANNTQVRWFPAEVGRGRFGEWLEGNVDWALSRERFWGTPLPAWVCDNVTTHTELIGSFKDLAERVGTLPEDFDPHKPWIDDLTWPCPSCEGTMRRTPEVIDVWFDSGAMPYAQWHYPFEGQDDWRRHFPADFICEGVDQTRGWFYSLMAISTMLGHGPAYRNVVVNDLLLDREGRKMSKSRGNVVDPWKAISDFGADALRWYLFTVSQPWVPKRYDPEALDEAARRTFDTLTNTYRFFALYANLEDWSPSAQDPPPGDRPLMDRWILSRVNRLAQDVGGELESYEITRAARAISVFIVDDLSNWYVRRTRDRFWGSADAADTRAAFRTLSDVLAMTAALLAPFVPFLSDWLHRALRNGESVHLARFPQPREDLMDAQLEEGMGVVRTLSRLGRSARLAARIRIRQPLRTLYAVTPGGRTVDDELLRVLADELNVKEIRFVEAAGELLELRALPDYRALGPRFGPKTALVAEEVKNLPSRSLRALKPGDSLRVTVDGATVQLADHEFTVKEEAREDLIVESDAGFTVALDRSVDDELRLEGLARELVNRIQRLRRDSGLQVEDRICLGISGAGVVQQAAEAHREYIARETLARSYFVGDGPPSGDLAVRELELDGFQARIALAVEP